MESKTPRFYELSISSRLEQLAREADLPLEDLLPLGGKPILTTETADHMIENAVGVYGMPLGIARNFFYGETGPRGRRLCRYDNRA